MHKRRPPRCRCRTPRAFGLVDVVIALTLLGLMLALLSIATARRTQFATRASAHRELARQAEAAMLSLQAGVAAEAPPTVQIRMEPLDNQAPTGQAWVRITAAREDDPQRQAHLVGLVPESVVPRSEARP